MLISLPYTQRLAGVHLVVFNHFNVPYSMSIEQTGKQVHIVFELKDDLPPKLLYDIGACVMQMHLGIDRLLSEEVWPIGAV